MPCYDAQSAEEDRENRELVRKYEATLCAIIKELEDMDIDEEVMTRAGLNGEIDLFDFWRKHSQRDTAKIARILTKLSPHERLLMLRLLVAVEENYGEQL